MLNLYSVSLLMMMVMMMNFDDGDDAELICSCGFFNFYV